MIVLNDNPDELWLSSPLGGPVAKPKRPEGLGLAAAARQNNGPYNVWLALNSSDVGPRDPDYNPFADERIKGTRFEDQYPDKFTYSRNAGHTATIIAGIEQEEQDQQDRAARGWGGTAIDLAMGIADPTMWFGPGAVVRGVRGGYSVARTAGAGMSAGAAQGLIYEAELRANQTLRTPEQTVLNISASTLLTGLIGGGAAALMGRTERKAAEKAISEFRTSTSAPAINAGRSAGAAETELLDAGLAPLLPEKLGSALEKGKELVGKVPYVGKPLKTILSLPEKAIKGVDPVTRVLSKSYEEGHRIAADLADIGGYTRGNLKGQVTTHYGASAEREVRDALQTAEYRMVRETERAYRDVVYGDAQTKFAKTRTFASNALGKSEPRMTMEEFHKEIDWALRNEDTHSNPAIQALVRNVYRPVMDEWKDRGVAAGLMKDTDAPPLGAKSYAPRVPNREATVRDRPGFMDVIKKHRREQDIVKKSLQDDATVWWEKLNSAADEAARQEARTKLEELIEKWTGKTAKDALKALEKRAEAEADRVRGAEPDPLLSDGAWRDETVVVTADGKPAMLKAGTAVDFLNARMKAVNNLLECIRAS